MHLIIGLGIAVLLITAYVISTVSKLKDNSAAMEQATRELIVRLQNIEGRLDETGRGINGSFPALKNGYGVVISGAVSMFVPFSRLCVWHIVPCDAILVAISICEAIFA